MKAATRQVLVIDDDPATREFFTIALESHGYRVVTAPNGLSALALVDAHQPDVILLDLLMPVMAGWEFLTIYRQRPGPLAPVIVCAATQRFREGALAAGAAAFVAKPVDLDCLLDVIARCLPAGEYGPASHGSPRRPSSPASSPR